MAKHNSGAGDVFKIKRFSIHDGPGIRTSVFLKGCPMKCVWCHSPEGISSFNSLWYNRNLCIACGECVQACPTDSLELTTGESPEIKIDRNTCSLSGDCVKTCPVNALQFTGYTVTIEEVMLEIEKDLAFYESSGGGVTLTGGEALYQPQFSTEILKRCKELNIHTAIETCLYCEKDDIDLIISYVDLFYIDLKLFDAILHKQYTGRSNKKIKENFKYIAASGKKIIVRIPLIEDITDTNLNRTAIMDFVFEADRNIPVELISYNPLTENNYTRLGLPFILKKNV